MLRTDWCGAPWRMRSIVLHAHEHGTFLNLAARRYLRQIQSMSGGSRCTELYCAFQGVQTQSCQLLAPLTLRHRPFGGKAIWGRRLTYVGMHILLWCALLTCCACHRRHVSQQDEQLMPLLSLAPPMATSRG